MSKNVCAEKTFYNTFRTHAQGLRNFLYYKTGSLPRAEDLVQDAFGKLWENCAKVSPEKAKSYLFTVGNNLFLNQVAHEKVKLKFQKQDHPQQSNETPEFIMEVTELRDQLEKAIAQLPDSQRLVFLMNRIDGKKYREIAEELGISQKAVEKRMHKALKELRKVIKQV